jgi:hypothetical protein
MKIAQKVIIIAGVKTRKEEGRATGYYVDS